MIVLGVVLVYFCGFSEIKIPGKQASSARKCSSKDMITYSTISSTPKLFLHSSVAMIIAFALARSNFRARRNLDIDQRSKLARRRSKTTRSRVTYLNRVASSIRSGTKYPSACSSSLNFCRICSCWAVRFPRRPGGGVQVVSVAVCGCVAMMGPTGGVRRWPSCARSSAREPQPLRSRRRSTFPGETPREDAEVSADTGVRCQHSDRPPALPLGTGPA